MQKESI